MKRRILGFHADFTRIILGIQMDRIAIDLAAGRNPPGEIHPKIAKR